MLGTWILLVTVALVIWMWMDALRAREIAIHHGRVLCKEAGVQLLDQSVSLKRLRIARRDGLPTLIRRYQLEISIDGSDRHRGHLDLAAHRLESWSLPLINNEPAASLPARPDYLRIVE